MPIFLKFGSFDHLELKINKPITPALGNVQTYFVFPSYEACNFTTSSKLLTTL